MARRLDQLAAVRGEVRAGAQLDLVALLQELDLDPAACGFGRGAGLAGFVGRRPRRAPRAADHAAADLLDARQRTLLPERKHAGDVIRWPVSQADAQPAAAGRRRACGAAQLGRLEPHLLGEHGVEAAQALEAAGERDLGDGQVGVGQQLLGLQQPLRRQVVDRADPVRLGEDAPQVALGDAQPAGEIGHAHGSADAHGMIDHARRVLREHVRRIHQAQARRELRTAAQARPEAGLFGRGGVGIEAAVLTPRRAHPAHRTAVDARRRDAHEEAAVEAGVVRGEGLPGDVGIEFHAVIIGTLQARTRRFRTCVFRVAYRSETPAACHAARAAVLHSRLTSPTANAAEKVFPAAPDARFPGHRLLLQAH